MTVLYFELFASVNELGKEDTTLEKSNEFFPFHLFP